MMGRLAVAYCGAVEGGPIIPHQAEQIPGGGGSDITYWRVPEFCIRDDVEINKKPVAEKYWGLATVYIEG
jgi:hypothetical protein